MEHQRHVSRLGLVAVVVELELVGPHVPGRVGRRAARPGAIEQAVAVLSFEEEFLAGTVARAALLLDVLRRVVAIDRLLDLAFLGGDVESAARSFDLKALGRVLDEKLPLAARLVGELVEAQAIALNADVVAHEDGVAHGFDGGAPLAADLVGLDDRSLGQEGDLDAACRVGGEADTGGFLRLSHSWPGRGRRSRNRSRWRLG